MCAHIAHTYCIHDKVHAPPAMLICERRPFLNKEVPGHGAAHIVGRHQVQGLQGTR